MSQAKVFVGSSSEGLDVARAIQANLARPQVGRAVSRVVTVWDQGVFDPTRSYLESLVKRMAEYDFAVLVLTADDLSTSRGATMSAARDNVIFELGFCVGTLGRNRTFMVFDHGNVPGLPSDLDGVVGLAYQTPDDPHDLDSALGPACTRIEAAIRRLGRRAAGAGAVEQVSAPDRPVDVRVVTGTCRDRRQDLLASLDGKQLFHRWHDGGGWSEWTAVGNDATEVAALCSCSSVRNLWEVYAADSEGQLRYRYYRHGQDWTGWYEMPTREPVAALAAASMGEGQRVLFAVSPVGAVHHRWQRFNDEWDDLRTPRPMRAIACRSPMAGALEVFALDDRGHVFESSVTSDRVWSDWQAMSVPARATAIAAGGLGVGHSELYIALDDGRVLQSWRSEGADWSGWYEFGPDATAATLACASRTSGEQEVFAVSPRGTLRRIYYIGEQEWSPWTAVALPT
jgi:hypothetical protein